MEESGYVRNCELDGNSYLSFQVVVGYLTLGIIQKVRNITYIQGLVFVQTKDMCGWGTDCPNYVHSPYENDVCK